MYAYALADAGNRKFVGLSPKGPEFGGDGLFERQGDSSFGLFKVL